MNSSWHCSRCRQPKTAELTRSPDRQGKRVFASRHKVANCCGIILRKLSVDSIASTEPAKIAPVATPPERPKDELLCRNDKQNPTTIHWNPVSSALVTGFVCSSERNNDYQ